MTVGGTPEEQLQWAHAHLEAYSGLPNYRNSWLRQGYDESDLVKGGSDRLARTIVGVRSIDDAERSSTGSVGSATGMGSSLATRSLRSPSIALGP